MLKPCGPLLSSSGYQLWRGLYKSFCLPPPITDIGKWLVHAWISFEFLLTSCVSFPISIVFGIIMFQVWHFVITCGDVACGDHLIIPPTFSTVVKEFPTYFTTLLDSSHTAFLFYLNIFSPTCLLSGYLNKCFQFTSKVPQNLSDDYNLLLIYPKETLSEIFLFFYVKAKTQNCKFIYQWCIQAVWETSIPVWLLKLWHLKNTFQVFIFQFSFWNSLEYKNVERREKQWDKKVEKKEETVNESAFTYITT